MIGDMLCVSRLVLNKYLLCFIKSTEIMKLAKFHERNKFYLHTILLSFILDTFPYVQNTITLALIFVALLEILSNTVCILEIVGITMTSK